MTPRLEPRGLDLERAVRTLGTIVSEQVKRNKAHIWVEAELRRELVSCILGSQVSYKVALSFTDNLDHAGLLHDWWWSGHTRRRFGELVFAVLSGKRPDAPHAGSYRFPRVRSQQLAQARDALAEVALCTRLSWHEDPKTVRTSLVAAIPGLGPKQASMLLRNIGLTYDLAVLDTHVIRFLRAVGLIADEAPPMGQAGYERIEAVFVEYAQSMGHQPGYLDWAIWATMKAVGQQRV